jgi:hypothetical protein
MGTKVAWVVVCDVLACSERAALDFTVAMLAQREAHHERDVASALHVVPATVQLLLMPSLGWWRRCVAAN